MALKHDLAMKKRITGAKIACLDINLQKAISELIPPISVVRGVCWCVTPKCVRQLCIYNIHEVRTTSLITIAKEAVFIIAAH